MRKTFAAMLLASLVATTPVLAQTKHHAGDGHLVVSGRHSGSALFEVSTPLKYRYMAEPPTATFNYRGRYAGLFIFKGKSLVTGVVADVGIGAVVPVGRQTVTLRPGLYRLVLAADAPATVSLALQTPYSYDFDATGPASVSRRSADASPASPLGAGYASTPISVRRTSWVFANYAIHATAAQAGQAEVCARKQPVPCASAAGGAGLSKTIGSPGSQYDSRDVVTAAYSPGSLPAGHDFASGDDQMLGMQDSARLVAYVIG